MIEKPSIIITSLGRTGTTFFSRFLRDVIPDCDSFHEPDIVQYFGTKGRFGSFIQRVRDAGVYNMVFLKALGKWSLIKVSDQRLRGELDEGRAAREVLRQRRRFVNTKPGRVYVESNAGYYGLIDVAKGVFMNHRVVFVIRDGRDWVASSMNVEELYGKKGLRNILAHQMPAASEFPDDPLHDSWESRSRFEKLCWAWAKLNEYAVSTVSANPCARMFHFEKIFSGPDRYTYTQDLLSFATSLPGLDAGRIGRIDGKLESRVNESSYNFPAWEGWSAEQKSQFERICGPLMRKLGYESRA